MSVLVHMLIGGEAYAESARISLEALLADSPFNIVVVHTPGLEASLPIHPRLQRLILPAIPPTAHRADRFLQKFDAIKLCLEHSVHEWIIQLDADVVLARPITEKDVVSALAGAKLGMVEQTTVTGSGMNRSSFLEHYTRHTLGLIDPDADPPPLNAFRYYNSGVVLGTRSEWELLVPWAIDRIGRHSGAHQIGKHMIADQDYFQYWAITLHPGHCVDLPWYWNHCEYWDDRFPRRGVLFAHFSNFCQGPASDTPARMRKLRRPWTRLINRCIPPSLS